VSLVIGCIGLTGITFVRPTAFAALEASALPQAVAASWILRRDALLAQTRIMRVPSASAP
jgi:hypothetical protein